jgi:hypothetical protein
MLKSSLFLSLDNSLSPSFSPCPLSSDSIISKTKKTKTSCPITHIRLPKNLIHSLIMQLPNRPINTLSRTLISPMRGLRPLFTLVLILLYVNPFSPYLISPRIIDFSQAVCPLSWSDTFYDAGSWHVISTQSIGYQPILFAATTVPANRIGYTRPANPRKETQRLSSVRGKFRTSIRPQAAYAHSQRAERVCLPSV